MKPIRIACVGDSITEGFGGTPYPKQLQKLLGKNYEVKNFGKFGTHLRIFDSPWSYSKTAEYRGALNYLPDVVLFMLGTNDRLDEDFPFIDEYFQKDFVTLTESFLTLRSRPKIYVCTPPFCYLEDGTADRVNRDIRSRIIKFAGECELPIIDMNTCTADSGYLFPDKLHPDTAGYALIAESFYRYAFGGEMFTVTVETEPFAEVTLNNRLLMADENGIAEFVTVGGEKIKVKSGKKSKVCDIDRDMGIILL